MRIFATVVPGASPSAVIDIYVVPVPIEAAVSRPPSPRPEEKSKRNAKAETNSAAHIKSGPRREEDNSRIVIRHHYVAGIDRHDGDVWSIANHNLGVASQISIV